MYGAEAAFPEAGIELEAFRLFVELELPHFAVRRQEIAGETPDREALKTERDCYWEALGGFSRTKIYAWEKLKPGNHIQGPAVIEEKKTTVVVPPRSKVTVDAYENYLVTLS